MKIAIMGLGYIGAVSAACFASLGHQVIGCDIKQGKVDAINCGKVAELYEEGLQDLVKKQYGKGRLRATLKMQEAVDNSDIGFICVGTPSKKDGAMDFKYLKRVSKEVGLCLKKRGRGYIIVIRSTMFPGSFNKIVKIIEKASGYSEKKGEFKLVVNPEFLREGTAIKDFFNPPYIVIGAKCQPIGEKALKCYKKISVKKFIVHPDIAQMIKYANNSWHATKVTFANEIGAICKTLNIDAQVVMKLFCEDKQLNISSYYMRPGFAYGGTCLSKDTDALIKEAEKLKVQIPLLSAVPKSNQAQVARAIEQINKTGKKSIGFLGLSFKPGTDDMRSNPINEVINHFERRKGYDIKTWDKHRDNNNSKLMAEILEQEVIVISNTDKELLEIAQDMASDKIIINLQK